MCARVCVCACVCVGSRMVLEWSCPHAVGGPPSQCQCACSLRVDRLCTITPSTAGQWQVQEGELCAMCRAGFPCGSALLGVLVCLVMCCDESDMSMATELEVCTVCLPAV